MDNNGTGLIDPPKKWAYLVAVGPASIVAGLLAVVLLAAGLPGSQEAFILWLLLGFVSLPAVIVGTWFDVGAVEDATGVVQKRWVWAAFGLFFAPLVGTVYLWSRRSWFREDLDA